jgi:hypothetical protein
MDKTRIKPKRRTILSRPWDRADHRFTIASLALMVFMVVAGFGAWIFGNSGEAAVIPSAPYSSVR